MPVDVGPVSDFEDRRFRIVQAQGREVGVLRWRDRFFAVHNRCPQDAWLHVLPTLWFRNTWSWDNDPVKPSLTLEDGAVVAEHPQLGRRVLSASGRPEPLFCEN